MLSSEYASERESNQDYLPKVSQNIQFLSWQGIGFRGNHDETDSNFVQLLKLCGIDGPSISQHTDKKMNKYTSHQLQITNYHGT